MGDICIVVSCSQMSRHGKKKSFDKKTKNEEKKFDTVGLFLDEWEERGGGGRVFF